MFEVGVWRTFNKPNLLWISFFLKTGSPVRHAQQCDADADVARRANDFAREQVWIRIGRTVARVMNVVKLADSRDSRQRHLEKRHPRSGVNVFRLEAVRSRIHLFAPRPKGVSRVLRTMLRATADHTLKRV